MATRLQNDGRRRKGLRYEGTVTLDDEQGRTSSLAIPTVAFMNMVTEFS